MTKQMLSDEQLKEIEKKYGCYYIDGKRHCARNVHGSGYAACGFPEDDDVCLIEYLHGKRKGKHYDLVFFKNQIGIREWNCPRDCKCKENNWHCGLTLEQARKAIIEFYEEKALNIRAMELEDFEKEFLVKEPKID